MIKLQRLLNVPSKLNDSTSILQAISKLISEKLNQNAIQNVLSAEQKKTNDTAVFNFRNS